MVTQYNRFKMLVDQVTGQVIWLTAFPDSQPAPTFDQSLESFKFSGFLEYDAWDMYSGFRLYYDSDAGTFSEKGITDDFKNKFLVVLKSLSLLLISMYCRTLLIKKTKTDTIFDFNASF